MAALSLAVAAAVDALALFKRMDIGIGALCGIKTLRQTSRDIAISHYHLLSAASANVKIIRRGDIISFLAAKYHAHGAQASMKIMAR